MKLTIFKGTFRWKQADEKEQTNYPNYQYEHIEVAADSFEMALKIIAQNHEMDTFRTLEKSEEMVEVLESKVV